MMMMMKVVVVVVVVVVLLLLLLLVMVMVVEVVKGWGWVEEIGSVYQAVMGFRIERRPGRALVLRSKGHHGAGVIVDIDALLAVKLSERKKRLNELEVAALTAREEKAVAGADTIEALAEALSGKI